jgi:Tfp pilus assembly protein PilO
VDNPRLPLFVAIGTVVLAIILIIFLVVPKMGQVSTAKEDLVAAQGDGQALQAQKSALEDTKAEAPQNRETIDQVQRQVPSTAEESGLLLLVNNAALDSGLDLTTIATSVALDETSGLSVISLTVSAVGTYNDVTQFTYAIETLPRAAKITTLTLNAASGSDTTGSPLLTMNATIQAFTSDTSAGPGSSPGPTAPVGG